MRHLPCLPLCRSFEKLSCVFPAATPCARQVRVFLLVPIADSALFALQPGEGRLGSSSRGDNGRVSTEEDAGAHAGNFLRQRHPGRPTTHNGDSSILCPQRPLETSGLQIRFNLICWDSSVAQTLESVWLGAQDRDTGLHVQDSVMRHAQTLPSGSFGRAYGDFMAQRGFHADDRPPVRFLDDEELAYVAMRSRETHDLWHVLFNCKTTVLGELALKAVEFVQVPQQALNQIPQAEHACLFT